MRLLTHSKITFNPEAIDTIVESFQGSCTVSFRGGEKKDFHADPSDFADFVLKACGDLPQV